MFLLMVLVAVGVGRFVNPLLLGYLVTFGYAVLGVLEGRKPVPMEVPEEQEQPEGHDPESGSAREPSAPKGAIRSLGGPSAESCPSEDGRLQRPSAGGTLSGRSL
jgi:hypothetical protein